MPSTRHTQGTSMCFHKNNRPKLVLFLPPALEIVDHDREPSEKLGSQIEEQVSPGHEDQVVWCLTRFWFSGPGHGQRRQNAP